MARPEGAWAADPPMVTESVALSRLEAMPVATTRADAGLVTVKLCTGPKVRAPPTDAIDTAWT